MSSEVPIWPVFLRPVLEVLTEHSEVRRKDLRQLAIDVSGIGEEARVETIESGETRAGNRVDWAITHLSKAHFIEAVSRGVYQITQTGREWLDGHPEGINTHREANAEFDRYWSKKTNVPVVGLVDAGTAAVPDDNPTEQIENGITSIAEEVGDDLLGRLRDIHPDYFEEAVVQLLLAMGYGGAEQRGKRIGGAGDGGVDGVIDQDALGLDQVYVQAKRYGEANTVGREAIQAFIGALHGFGASRGVFITTSSFTRHALDYAQNIPTRIVLIDGRRLVNLMIKYKIGVQVKHVYEVVAIDEDFFA